MASLFLSRDLDEDSEMHIDYVDPAKHAERLDAEQAAAEQARTDAAFLARLHRISDDISLSADAKVLIDRDGATGSFYFRVVGTRRDTLTGELSPVESRPGHVYPDDTDTQIVRTVFRLYDTHCYEEAADTFLWRGFPVFGTQVSIEDQWEIAERYDARPTCPPAGTTTRMSDDEFVARLRAVCDDITLPPQFTVLIERDKQNPNGRFYFQIRAERADTYTGKMGFGQGGKAYLSEYATDSELMQTVFGLYASYCHHEARESFMWRGRRVFGPHMSTQARWEIAARRNA